MSQMTDRKLIAACAKFMGRKYRWLNCVDLTSGANYRVFQLFNQDCDDWEDYNPLANLTDSAALRHEGWISVFHWGEGVEASHWPKAECNERLSDHNNDRAKAEMYAVARCVAKMMEGK